MANPTRSHRTIASRACGCVLACMIMTTGCTSEYRESMSIYTAAPDDAFREEVDEVVAVSQEAANQLRLAREAILDMQRDPMPEHDRMIDVEVNLAQLHTWEVRRLTRSLAQGAEAYGFATDPVAEFTPVHDALDHALASLEAAVESVRRTNNNSSAENEAHDRDDESIQVNEALSTLADAIARVDDAIAAVTLR